MELNLLTFLENPALYYTLVTKWKSTGLLDDLDSVAEINMACHLEACAKYLIRIANDPDLELTEHVAGMILIVVARMVRKSPERSFDIKELYTNFRKFYQDNKDKFPTPVDEKFVIDAYFIEKMER